MGDSLCLPLLRALNLTMHCSGFLPPSHWSLKEMHAQTPILNNPEILKKKGEREREGFPAHSSRCRVSTSFSVVSLYWSAPQSSLCLYLAFCSLWITSSHLPLIPLHLFASCPSHLFKEKRWEEGLFYLHPSFIWHVSISLTPPHLNLSSSQPLCLTSVSYQHFLSSLLCFFYPLFLYFWLFICSASPLFFSSLFAHHVWYFSSVCPANDAETGWTVRREWWSLMFCWLYIHGVKKKESTRARQMGGQRDRDEMGRWAEWREGKQRTVESCAGEVWRQCCVK